MLKKVIGFLFVLLLAFSQSAFAEQWFELGNSSVIAYGDADSVKQRPLEGGLVVATVRIKMIEKKSGDIIISVLEYKTSPVKADSKGVFYRPKPLEARVVEAYMYDKNGTEQKRRVDYNSSWEMMTDKHQGSFNFWYAAMAFSMGGTGDTVKMKEKP